MYSSVSRLDVESVSGTPLGPQGSSEQQGSAMKVLVVGDGGYIGAVLVPFFREAGHEVTGLALGLYDGCDLGPAMTQPAGRVPVDMRDVTAAQLSGYDAVVC